MSDSARGNSIDRFVGSVGFGKAKTSTLKNDTSAKGNSATTPPKKKSSGEKNKRL